MPGDLQFEYGVVGRQDATADAEHRIARTLVAFAPGAVLGEPVRIVTTGVGGQVTTPSAAIYTIIHLGLLVKLEAGGAAAVVTLRTLFRDASEAIEGVYDVTATQPALLLSVSRRGIAGTAAEETNNMRVRLDSGGPIIVTPIMGATAN